MAALDAGRGEGEGPGGRGTGASAIPDAFTPPRGNPRFPFFDSLRAIAALSVLILHTAIFSNTLSASPSRWVLAHLDVGVTIFFLISGFLLYRPMLATRVLGTPSMGLGTYAWRRFLRLAPAYWVALLALTAFPGILGVLTHNWWVYFGLLQNYPIYTSSSDCLADVARCGIPPVWSLGIEVGFYAALPLFAWLLRRTTRALGRSRWLAVEVAALVLVSVVSLPIVSQRDTELQNLLWVLPIGHALWFALGMGLAVASVRAEQTRRRAAPIAWLAERATLAWAAAGAIFLLASLTLLEPVSGLADSGRAYAIQYGLFGLIAALLLFPAVFAGERPALPHRLLATRPLARLGLISYGIFLYHWPIAYALNRGGVNEWWPQGSFFVMTGLTLAITITCATASYVLVERPLLRLKRRLPSAVLPKGASPPRRGTLPR